MQNNICKFLSARNETQEINIINFVYEKENNKSREFICEEMYKMHIVTNGNGKLSILGNSFNISVGDIFFTFPSMNYNITSENKLEYMYISYVGIRTNEIMDKLSISRKNFIFGGFSDLIELWIKSITNERTNIELKCEGLLLYSFSMLGEKELKKQKDKSDTILLIKKYIDENFCDNTISLEKISNKFSYNKKYLSSYFKKIFGVGIAQYITMLRIQKACTLMEQGFTSVGDIAAQCGFSDSFYFSRVFKQKMGISPKEHISIIHKET